MDNYLDNRALVLDDLENKSKRQNEQLKAMIRDQYHRQMVSLARMNGFDVAPDEQTLINVPFNPK